MLAHVIDTKSFIQRIRYTIMLELRAAIEKASKSADQHDS